MSFVISNVGLPCFIKYKRINIFRLVTSGLLPCGCLISEM